MEFLLECIGFPPGHDVNELVERVRREGEPTPWRGPDGLHLRLPLAHGLELRLDQDAGEPQPTLLPHFRVPHRLRVAVDELRAVDGSPYDRLLEGRANPPGGDPANELDGEWRIAAYLTDARRLPRRLPAGHVLAVSVAGFALAVDWVGPNDERAPHAEALERPRGALLQPLGGARDPGGCMEVSARVREVRHAHNPLTGRPVELIEIDAPGRPLPLFVSAWQLQEDGLPPVRPGSRIEGTFLLSGRVAGGLPPARPARERAFG